MRSLAWPAQDSNLESAAPGADALSIRPTGLLTATKSSEQATPGYVVIDAKRRQQRAQ